METMVLYLIRHAEAVGRGSGDGSDDHRVLTPMGREIMESIARWCAEQHLLIEQILTSPLVRAIQTAEIIAAALHPREKVEVVPALGTGGSAGQIQRMLPEFNHLNSLALVGHEPTVGITASLMLNIEKKVAFAPGSVCSLSFHGKDRTPQATFRWMANAAYDSTTRGVKITTISNLELL